MPAPRLLLNQPQDHILANTWRLILEQTPWSGVKTPPQSVRDFSVLEQLLPEYRLIGVSLAGKKHLPYLD